MNDTDNVFGPHDRTRRRPLRHPGIVDFYDLNLLTRTIMYCHMFRRSSFSLLG